MQDEPAQRPFSRARIHHPRRRAGKMPGLSRAKQRRHLSRRRRSAIGRPSPPRCGDRGNPSTPRQRRLARSPRPGIGQSVPSQLIHQDERIKHHVLAQIAHPDNRLDHRRIRRRSTIHRAARQLRHQLRRAPGQSGHAPRHRHGIGRILLHLWAHRTLTRAQIIAKPGHHQRYRLAFRQFFVQRLNRHCKIGLARRGVHVDRQLLTKLLAQENRGRRQRIFPRPRDHRDTLDQPGEIARCCISRLGRRAKHLKRKLRHPVAKLRQRQILQHDISHAAIGWDLPHALDSCHLGIGQLGFRPQIDPQVQVIAGNLHPVRPDPAHTGNLSRTQRQRQ